MVYGKFRYDYGHLAVNGPVTPESVKRKIDITTPHNIEGTIFSGNQTLRLHSYRRVSIDNTFCCLEQRV
jgi:hypothetical protein